MNHKTITLILAAGLSIACWGENRREIEVSASEEFNTTKKCDITQLKKLALSSGWDFSPDRITEIYFKDLGINRIRGINIDKFPGEFDKNGNFRIHEGGMTTRLDAHLNTIARLNVIPHLVIGPHMPDELSKHTNQTSFREGIMGNVGISGRKYGPTDYDLYRNYYVAVFEYILVKKGFENAVFETFNEPDIGGGFIYSKPGVPPRGSKEAYDNLLKNYRTIAEAAEIFEMRHPGKKIVLGGPALAWAYTFKFGAFNWANRFIEDCTKQKIKLDFIGIHFYGNISPISGKPEKNFNVYPSFCDMMKKLKETIAKYNPSLPVYMTEYGPSFDVTRRPQAMVNADNIGAAWNMAFLKAMLENGVDTAVYLVTTDIARTDKDRGLPYNVWGWCSFFVNPEVYGYPYPKAPYHTFKMISELKGKRVRTKFSGNGMVDAIAAVNPEKRSLQIILWNYNALIPEGKCTIDRSVPETVTVRIKQAEKLFGKAPKMISRLIDAEHGNIYRLKDAETPISMNDALPKITSHGTIRMDGGTAYFSFRMPESSIAMIELGASPEFQIPDIPYSEDAARCFQLARLARWKWDNSTADKLLRRIPAIPDASPYQKSSALKLLLDEAVKRKNKTEIRKNAEALIALKDGASSRHRSCALLALAELSRENKKYAESNTLCQELLTFSPNRYDRMTAKLCMGRNLLNQKKYAEAEAVLNEIHKQDYYNGRTYRVPAYFITAYSRLKRNDPNGAVAIYEKVLNFPDASREDRLFAVNRIAQLSILRNDPEKALEYLNSTGEAAKLEAE